MEDARTGGGSDIEDKLTYFQAITGLQDLDLCTEILAAHDWDLNLAVSSITSSSSSVISDHPLPQPAPDAHPADNRNRRVQQLPPHPPPGIAWRIVTLPFYVISGGIGLVSGAVGVAAWIAGGIVSKSLGILGFYVPHGGSARDPLVPEVSPATAEAQAFLSDFQREIDAGTSTLRVNFVAQGFMDALQRSRQEFKLMFVYLHSPDHPDTFDFCNRCLCSEDLAQFVNENFVSWGGNIKRAEGFKMSGSLKASRYPFCAVVMAATNQRIALVRQIEGSKSPEELIFILQKVLEESGSVLAAARIEAEERRNNIRLREEQDAAYRAALEADQAREQQKKAEQEQLAREAAEAERKCKEEEEAKERAAQEAAEKEADSIRKRHEKAMLLGPEPEKGPNVTQVVIRFPSGDRKERRFRSSATVKSIYDYVDTLECFNAEKYMLISNFPRVSYGEEKQSLSLIEAGLHPQSSLFVEVES